MNKKLFTPLFIAASLLTIGCSTSEIIGRPDWIDADIVEGDLKDNKLKEIYDAIKKLGDTNANVLNKVMYDIAQKHLGSFVDLKAINDGKKSNVDIDAFINEHPIYQSENTAYQLGTDGAVDITNNVEVKRTISINKIKEQYKRIKEDIYKKLCDEIKGGSYSTKVDKYFQEDYFLQHLYKEMYYENYPEKNPTTLVTQRVFIPKAKETSWEEYVEANDTNKTGFLHLINDKGEFNECYAEYVNRKLLPEIYRTLLIENYVREQRYTNLGRSYARKVNMITIPRDSDKTTAGNVALMLQNFMRDTVTNAGTITRDYNLEYIKDAMVGFATTDQQTTGAGAETPTESMKRTYKMLDNSGAGGGLHFDKLQAHLVGGGEPVDFIWKIRTNEAGIAIKDSDDDYLSTYVYRGTKLYELAEKYLKIVDVTQITDTKRHGDFKCTLKQKFNSDEQSAYDDITNKGAYTVEKGLILKERELRLTDMTTDGWFLKDGGITDLNAEFRDKLFKINTSQIIDEEVEKDTPDINDTVRYFGSKEPDKTGRLTNRKAFVFAPGKDSAQASVVFNDGSSSFHIVEVEEAAAASKLSYTAPSDSYADLHKTKTLGESNNDMDGIVRKIVEQVGSSDTYKKNAEQYYLMISNILFYDQSVYDYFKSQFPDLFK